MLVSCKQFSTLPPPCRCQEHREIERFWDNVLVSCKQFSTLPPLADVRLLSQNRKNIEKSKDFVQNQKKPREIEKKKQKTKDSGTMCWYHVNILLDRLVFLFFFDFSRFLSVLDKIFRFLDVFLILDGFFRILNVFFDFGHLLLISRCF